MNTTTNLATLATPPLPLGRAALTAPTASHGFGITLRSAHTRTLRDDAQQAAEQFVATALVEPILKQLRESSSAPPPWGPGPGEKPFQAMADTALADRLVAGGRWPIVERLARGMRQHSSAAPPPTQSHAT